MRQTLLFTFLLVLVTACSQSTDPQLEENQDNETDHEVIDGTVVNAFPNLLFERPLSIQDAGDGSGRLFVVEQSGVISVFPDDPEASEASQFLNIEGRVTDASNEEGLLGLAFHPDFESNGYFYVNYTASNPDRTVISRFSVTGDDANQADAASETVLLTYDQPYGNHNGGHLAFGPDGYLYIAAGDGGSGGDPENNGQDRSTLLGAILRIDVDSQENGLAYGIPDDNPFVDNQEGYREEIYAYGLRNPWRFSFDTDTGDLWAADVGQNNLEEINIIEPGGNYGWNRMEGADCYPEGSSCSTDGLEMPVFDYSHDNGDRSVTGGYVYRGDDIPALNGFYIYADFVSGRIWALDTSDIENPTNIELFDANFRISSFGTNADNELFITSFDGSIYRFGRDISDVL